jgi:DNA recombination protein RmuC
VDLLPLVAALVVVLLVGLALGLAVGAARAAPLRARLADAELAEARLRAGDGEVERRARAVEAAVEPLRDHLDRVEGQLHALDRERVRAAAELREQVGTVAAGSARLERETAALVDALRRPQTRGRWGELHLRRVCEHAGMLDRCDFDEQVSVDGPDGPLRPDLVVRLTGGRTVVVDAKVTLAAYLEAVESDDERVRADRMSAHAKHLRAHVDRLGAKAYWRSLPSTPEFVVLFVPGEAFLAPALEADPALLEHAYARRVHLATPTTLLSMLRTVAYAWQQDALTENAQAVLVAGRELYDRLTTFGGHVDKLGRSLARGVTDFNAAVGSLERTLLPSARRLGELGLSGPLPSPTPVEDVVRPLSAPHLVALDGDSSRGPLVREA